MLSRQQALSGLPKSYVRQLAAEMKPAIELADAVLALHEAGLSHKSSALSFAVRLLTSFARCAQ